MLKLEELEVIMKRNNKEGLYCKHISDIYCNDTIYTINIFDIPRDPKKYLYVYQVNGCKCLKVTIENSYLYINRNSEDDITEFLILIGEQKDLDKFTISQYSEIQIITDLIDYFDDYKKYGKVDHKFNPVFSQKILSNKFESEIYTLGGLCKVVNLLDFNSENIKVILPNGEYGLINPSNIVIYHLYPVNENSSACFIAGDSMDEIDEIINSNKLYDKLGGEYIRDFSEGGDGTVCKINIEVISNAKKQVHL